MRAQNIDTVTSLEDFQCDCTWECNIFLLLIFFLSKNAIFIQAMPNRTYKIMVNVLKEIHKALKPRGWQPKLHVPDNEYSKAVHEYIRKENVRLQMDKPMVIV